MPYKDGLHSSSTNKVYLTTSRVKLVRSLIEFLSGSKRKSNQREYHSEFGGNWVDLVNAKDILNVKLASNSLSSELANSILFFIENGYVIIPQAVDHALIDAYLNDLGTVTGPASELKVSVPVIGPQDKDVVAIGEVDIRQPLVKILDTYVQLDSARKIIFSAAIVKFLKAVFDSGILAFQSLHFEIGSTQAIHQDTAYVVLDEPMKLCASWIALEDIQPGSGELMYYPGSHRLPDWIYSKKFKHFNHERDSHQAHLAHLEWLHTESKKRGFDLDHFYPKKGDALIWAADLAHGGAPIHDKGKTRRSLVAHYTNFENNPHYFRFVKQKNREKHAYNADDGLFYSTMYY